MSASTYARDIATRRTAAGVRADIDHRSSPVVHAHRTWTGESTMLTWCGLRVDLAEKGRQTTDLIRCRACGQASYLDMRGGAKP